MIMKDLLALKKSTKAKSTFESIETLHLLPWGDRLVHVRVVDGRSYDESSTLQVTVLAHGPQGLTTQATTSLPETRRFRVAIQGDDLLIFAARKSEDDRSLLLLRLGQLGDPAVALPFAPADAPIAIDDAGFLYSRHEDALVVHTPARQGAREVARLSVTWERDNKGFRDLAVSGTRLVLLGPADYTGLKLVDISDRRAPKILHAFVGKFSAPDYLVRVGADTFLAFGIGDKAHAFCIEGDRVVSRGTVAVGDRYQRSIVEGDSALLFGGYKKGERGAIVRIADGKPEKVGAVSFADSPVGVVLAGAGCFIGYSEGISELAVRRMIASPV